MKISIAMATYNGAAHLREQLDSFACQSRLPDEVVVCDDGSEDSTIRQLEAFSNEAAFKVRIHRNPENLGYAKNFEQAISLCSGDLIFLSDQDDVWFSEKLERVRNVFLDKPDLLVTVNDAQIVDESLGDTGLTKYGQHRALGLPDAAFIVGCCSAFRKTLVPLICPVPAEFFGHDAWIHALANRLKVRRLIPDVLQSYRRHESNTSRGLGSRSSRQGPLDLLHAYKGESSRQWCEKRLLRLAALTERIGRVGPGVLQPLGLGDSISIALQSLDAERSAATNRLRLLNMPRLRRLLPALNLYLQGQYKPFSGWKSLVKDVTRG